MGKSAIALVAGLIAVSTQAQEIHKVSPVQGYGCSQLNATLEQIRANTVHVPVYSSPSASSPTIGESGQIVFTSEPPRVVNGFVALVFPNGRKGWIAANALRPFHSLSNPDAHCAPWLMSNGMVGPVVR